MTEETARKVEVCVDELIKDFREAPKGFYKEGTVHCHLYHLLTEAPVNECALTTAGFKMRRVQKEYPPIEPDGNGRRGHYDLVVLDDIAMAGIDWWNHRRKDQTPLGTPVGPTVAIELGVNKGLTQDQEGTEGRLHEAEKELRRLTNPKNDVGWGLLLYFYRYAPFHRKTMGAVTKLLKRKAARYRNSNVTVVAVGMGNRGVTEQDYYELRIRAGVLVKDEGAFAEPS